MKRYSRIMLGAKSIYAEQARKEGFIGADYGFDTDLTGQLPDDWRVFNRQNIPVYLQHFPEKSKVAAGLACGMLWTICKGLHTGDVVLCPDGQGNYYTGEITGDYRFVQSEVLPHRRPVHWYNEVIARADMSPELQRSTNSIGTSCDVTKYSQEIEGFLGNAQVPQLVARDASIEDPTAFALEKHLEDFLVKNWNQTLLGKRYHIYEDEGEMVGQQYPSDTGNMDILALSKNGKELLVVELKKGRASDAVVGQVQRYMGYVQAELAEEGQTVRGAIIALEDDLRLKRALSVAPNIDFYRYEVSFELNKE